MSFIKEFRAEKGLSQKQFAEKVELSVRKISMIENNKGCSIEEACGICNAFPEDLEIKEMTIQHKPYS